jgi:serine/threonine-protein kinase SMG1
MPQLFSAAGTCQDPKALATIKSAVLKLAAARPGAVVLHATADLDGVAPGSTRQEILELAVDVCSRAAGDPNLPAQLRAFFQELDRLAVLPHEHWYSLLQEAHAATVKRASQMAAALKALPKEEQGAAALEWYPCAVAPVLLALKAHLSAAEMVEAETPVEKAFAEVTLPALRRLTSELARRPDPGRGSAGLQEQLAAVGTAATELGRGLSRGAMPLVELSPALAAMADTCIPMPGKG